MYQMKFCTILRISLLSSVLLLSTFVAETKAYGFGRCPKYPSMPKFNMSRVSYPRL